MNTDITPARQEKHMVRIWFLVWLLSHTSLAWSSSGNGPLSPYAKRKKQKRSLRGSVKLTVWARTKLSQHRKFPLYLPKTIRSTPQRRQCLYWKRKDNQPHLLSDKVSRPPFSLVRLFLPCSASSSEAYSEIERNRFSSFLVTVAPHLLFHSVTSGFGSNAIGSGIFLLLIVEQLLRLLVCVSHDAALCRVFEPTTIANLCSYKLQRLLNLRKRKKKGKKRKTLLQLQQSLLHRPYLSAQTISVETNAKTLRDTETKAPGKKPPKTKEKREKGRVLQTLNEAPRPQGKTWNHLVRWSIQGTVDSRRRQGTTSWVVFVERAERSNDCTVEMNHHLVGDLKISNSLVTNLQYLFLFFYREFHQKCYSFQKISVFETKIAEQNFWSKV